MTLSELIQKVGEENIGVQYVAQCMTSISFNEKLQSSKVTIETDKITPNDIVLNEGNVGLILWVPKDKWPKDIYKHL